MAALLGPWLSHAQYPSTDATGNSNSSHAGRGLSVSSSIKDKQCVICLDGLAEMGIVHGGIAHTCLCRTCCQALPVGFPCPLCRQPAEAFLFVY